MERKSQKNRIKGLLEKYLEIVNSEKNKKNVVLWKDAHNWNRDQWRGIPRAYSDRDSIPTTVGPDNSMWGRLINTSLIDYYTDPYDYLEMQLRMKIWHFENFKDNLVMTDELFIWFGVITELTMFGVEVELFDHKEGWIKKKALDRPEDLEKIEYPDFYKSGFMPRIHSFYEALSELANGKLKVMFPDFVRGPFCIAAHMRGLENMLFDTITDPGFVHEIMRFVTDAHKSWTYERNRFTGEGMKKCKLYNDEIDCPSLSPVTYEELILPYEIEIAEYHGGVTYWHSCGNTTRFMKSIKKLPGLEMYHVSPSTSYSEADAVFGQDTALDICLDPMKDVLDKDEDGMRSKLRDIITSCPGMNYAVRADAFMPGSDFGFLVEKMKKWSSVAAGYLNKENVGRIIREVD